MRAVSILAMLASLNLSTTASAYEKPEFPRLGGIKFGAPHNYEDPAYQAKLARLHLVVLANWPGWESGRGTTMQQVVLGIKSRNPTTLVFTYINVNERSTKDGTAWEKVRQKLNSEKWWLYPKATSGVPVVSTWGPDFGITNYTMGAQQNSAGERYNEWYPRLVHQDLFMPAPAMDGAFTDNFFWKPRVNGDWNRDGITDSQDDPSIQRLHREGMRRHVEVLKQLMPGKFQMGNIGPWGRDGAVFPEFEQLLHGGLLERYIGETWSLEGQDWQGNLNGWGSWNEMMRGYRKVMASIAEPKLLIFMQYGNQNDYRAFRYGFASCLMDDAYFDFASRATGYSDVPMFDEYDVTLGRAISAPPKSAWSSGVFRRDFENGIVLVNPRGNGDKTVDLGEDFKRISGTQDPTVNSGQITRGLTLRDRDGIILLRLDTTSKPKPPSGVTVEH